MFSLIFPREYVEKIVNEHIETYDENDKRDLVDYYYAHKLSTGSFDYPKFINAMIIFMGDGIESLGQLIIFVLKYLCVYQDLQKQV